MDELVAIGQYRGQGRIVGLHEPDMPGEAGLRHPLYVVEHGMDIDGFASDRAGIAEGLHAVDELDDPVGLFADEARGALGLNLAPTFQGVAQHL